MKAFIYDEAVADQSWQLVAMAPVSVPVVPEGWCHPGCWLHQCQTWMFDFGHSFFMCLFVPEKRGVCFVVKESMGE